MAFFQNSVLKKYLQSLDKQQILVAYSKFKEHFHNREIQQNIRSSKEEQYQEGFLRDLFVGVLGYTLNPVAGFNLTTEYKNVKDSKKADGAIILPVGHAPLASHAPLVKAVIELKGTDTTDLDKIETQAFGYKNNQPECTYIIISNFEKLRFYIDNAIDHIEFNLFTLTKKEFELLWLCLAYENIAANLPKEIKNASLSEEDTITKNLYKDYSLFKRELHQNLVALNPEIDELLLYKKSQKLLDRFLFLMFAEDRQLLPPNSVREILNQWNKLKELDAYSPLYSRFKMYFGYLNTGHKGKYHDVFAYNGGLFKPDEILDAVKIDDELMYRHMMKLSEYDFVSEVNVNILGHIFENSLNELDEIKALLDGFSAFPLGRSGGVTKRKKDGVFYTPKYITKYIVDNTVGKLCAEKRAELGIKDEDFITRGNAPLQKKVKQALFNKLKAYREWLLQITICDPACGSGAFLVQALDFLISEHRYIDELQAKLFGDTLVLSDVEKSILENNLFGVDINEESVEIAKLSLWLRTAQPNRKLNDLNNNIKCGNSLIDDPAVAGDKAFDWHKEFQQIFKKKNKKAWHITTATHNSRYSQRMYDNYVKLGEPVWLTPEDEIIITQTVAEIAEADRLNILAYNICGDHMHIALVCEEVEVEKIVGKLKSMSARAANMAMGRTTRGHAPLSDATRERGETQTQLWTQKYGCKEITSKEQLYNTIEYIRNNRRKHALPEFGTNNGACPIVDISVSDTPAIDAANYANTGACPCVDSPRVDIPDFYPRIVSPEEAFRPEYKGGFDVVIGNPPYGAKIDKQQIQLVSEKYSNWGISGSLNDTYFIFYAMSLQNLLKSKGYLGFITPNTWKLIESAKTFRNNLLNTNYQPIQIVQHINKVFADATVDCDTLIIRKYNAKDDIRILFMNSSFIEKEHFVAYNTISKQDYVNLFLTQADYNLKVKISTNSVLVKDAFIVKNGVKPYEKGKGKPAQTEQTMKEKPFTSEIKKDESFSPLIGGSSFNKYVILWNNDNWIQYGEWLAASRDIDIFEADEKLIFRQTSDSIIGTIISKGYIIRNNTHILLNKIELNYNLKYVLAILNSKLIDWYYWTINPEKGEAMAEVKAFHLGMLPIFPLNKEDQQPFITKANAMLSYNKELHLLVGKFQRMLQRKFDLEELPVKLQNWYTLSFKEFIAELGKKKIKFTLANEAEWEDYFSAEQAKAIDIKKQIDDTDREIDRMVYSLYELTEEEIKIVEGK